MSSINQALAEVTLKHYVDTSDIENEILRQSNKLVTAMFNLDLLEFQLVCTALLAVTQKNEKNEPYDATTVFTITADDMNKIWGSNLDTGAVYKQLKKTAISITGKTFSYWNEDEKTGELKLSHSSWFAYVTESNPENKHGCNYIDFGFPKPLIPTLKNCDEKFTWNFVNEIRNIKKSFYAVRLYILMSRYKNLKSNQIRITVDDFRAMYDLKNKYTLMADFRKRVIDEPVELINSETRLKITVTPEKKGRNIVAFLFDCTFDEKDLNYLKALGKEVKAIEQKTGDERDPDTLDLLTTLTDKQVKFYLAKLLEDAEFTGYKGRSGEPAKDFKERIYKDLYDPIKIAEYMPYLLKHGFDPNYKSNIKKA
ncbi:MAG: replication initiation protein [Sedimentibacter sp.]